MTTIPNDPLFRYQWHLYNYGQNGGIPGVDLNVVNVWDDYTGRGVLVGVFEGDGVEYDHPDLAANYDTTRDYDGVTNGGNPYPLIGESGHATSVAGVIGAVAGNGIGGVGVAYGASLASFRFLFSDDASEIRALQRLRYVDVANNSWGNTAFFNANFLDPAQALVGQAIQDAVRFGRNGLGTAIVFSGGNNRQQGLDTNYSNLTNSRYAIAVAALDNYGWATSYSTPGASILVSAFGSDPSSIVTTDRRANGYYNYQFDGTSAAAPMVSGVIALMLEANPNLGYRDIQEILAYSARQNDRYGLGGDYYWQINGANNWNGGGLHVSNDYGFGLVDALAAVRLAETWQKQSRFDNEQYLSYSSGNLGWMIPDNDFWGISNSLWVTAGLEIDTVEVELNLTHPYRGDLVVTLTSPSGTESVLVNRPGNGRDSDDNIVFKLSSTQYWGETSGGRWTLTVQDLGSADVGVLNSWKLNLYGDADTANDTYFYTNEYGIYGRTTLTDSSGVDTINAAAITSSSILNLTSGSTSILNGNFLSISAGTVIENAYTGDGNDIITGNSAANVLSGGRGGDIIYGGAGDDTLLGGAGMDILRGDEGNDILVGGAGMDMLTGGLGADYFAFNSPNEGFDSITDFNVVDDTIVVSASGFGGGLVAGVLAANRFVIGSAATTTSQRFIYDRTFGSLYFDPDGTGAIAKIQFATLSTGLAMTNADILVAA
ncbi:S8 family serine peptidase [Fortiea contorta]|uniref:S8 family serine peptidase n=1 Tax=Fortiea contorta TaxID=1892405 RepID=UPI0003478120|nr:S8 family serine peptidase [Fortiea contorta]